MNPFTKRQLILATISFFIGSGYVSAQRLAPFLSLTGNRGLPAITKPVPYEKTQSRFEYIDSTSSFLVQKKTGWTYTAYFEIKDSLQEFGLRVVSPLPDLVGPRKGDIVTPSFETKPPKDLTGFKPEVYLMVGNRADLSFREITDMTPLKQKDWKNPGIRITDGDKGTPLAPGIYKLIIFTQDHTKPAGSFVLQFGSIPVVPMPILVNKPDALK